MSPSGTLLLRGGTWVAMGPGLAGGSTRSRITPGSTTSATALAVRRTQAMSTDGWQFSGDAVRFLQGGTAAAVRGARKALSAEFNSEAGADGWCRIRLTARTRTAAVTNFCNKFA